jgi:hypothetical protein
MGISTRKSCARLRFTFDDPAMVADDLGTSARPRPARGLGGHERVEQVRQSRRHARPVVPDAEFERQRHARLAPGSDSRTPGRNAGRQLISPSFAPSPIASAAFFTRLGTLDELVAIGEHRRQRGIVVLDELDVSREAGLRERFTCRAPRGC